MEMPCNGKSTKGALFHLDGDSTYGLSLNAKPLESERTTAPDTSMNIKRFHKLSIGRLGFSTFDVSWMKGLLGKNTREGTNIFCIYC